MVFSKVYTSMRADNNLGCSFAIVVKENAERRGNDSVLIIIKDRDIAVLDYNRYRCDKELPPRYLLIKQHRDDRVCFRDFLKLIGKMCKNSMDSKYFGSRRDENNRMLLDDSGRFVPEEKYKACRTEYDLRLTACQEYISKSFCTDAFKKSNT